MKYKTYSDLPNNIKSAIQQLEDPNPEALAGR
jgi:cation transport regulator ChaB